MPCIECVPMKGKSGTHRVPLVPGVGWRVHLVRALSERSERSEALSEY